MDYVQALFTLLYAPLFGTILLECFGTRHLRRRFLGAAGGNCFVRLACGYRVKADPGALSYIALCLMPKSMAENTVPGLWSWIICVVVTVAVEVSRLGPTGGRVGWPGFNEPIHYPTNDYLCINALYSGTIIVGVVF